MNSQPGGFFTAVLMLVPLVGVPAAAIVGIPALPGTTSAVADELTIVDQLDAIEGSGSTDLASNSGGWDELDDLLSPVPSAPPVTHQRAVVAPATQAPSITDPFGSQEPLYSPFVDTSSANEFNDMGRIDSAPDNAPFEPEDISLTSFANNSSNEPEWSENDQPTAASIASVAPAVQPNTVSRIPQTWEQAVRELNRLGVRTYRLEEDAVRGGYHFFCVFSPQDEPNIRHRFDGTASQPLAAVVDVLTQIELWRNAR